MKVIITTFANRKDIVLVKPEKKLVIPYSAGEIIIEKDEEKEILKGLAKVYLKDFETDNEYHENARRKMMGISHFEIELKEKEYIFKTKKIEEDTETKNKEPEFKELEKLNQEVEKSKCKATTKAGKPCKSFAIEDSEFCVFHNK